MIHYYKFFCSRENLKDIREFVKNVLRNYSLSEVEVNQIVVAVDEVCSNLIIHAHNCNANDSVELSIKNQKESITFEIIDKGAPFFDISNHQDPDIEQLIRKGKNGGVGLMIVKKVMDKVEVEHHGTHNTWRLHKELPIQTRV